MIRIALFTSILCLALLSLARAADPGDSLGPHHDVSVDAMVPADSNSPAGTEEAIESKKNKKKKESPWLIAPLVSSDPKISTALGLLAGYVYDFDVNSPPSLIGAMGSYSITHSYYYGAFAKLHFGQDQHRLIVGGLNARVNNDYSDFQGTGLPLQTTDNAKVFALRYSTKVYPRWYVGPQFISTNYAIGADNALAGWLLEKIGLTGFQSNGLGLYVEYDSRDNQYSPNRGQVFEVHNIAYRRGFGGDVNFDSYNAGYRYFMHHGKGHVLALQAKGRWSVGAPMSGYSSVSLRGYTAGQYLAPYVTSIEAEERFALTEKWGLRGFMGVAALYGSDRYSGSDRFFPALGGGASYRLNEDGMIVRAEYALGKEGNQGFYLSFGQPF
ncbi:hypothetical protein ACFL6U_25110 [Planctomycetota bacterium]